MLNLHHEDARDLRAFWAGQEAGGSLLHDLTRNGNEGILQNMAPAQDWVGGPQGFALDLDGIDDFVQVSHSPTLNITGKQITCEVWFRARSIPANFVSPLCKTTSNLWNDGYGFYLRTSPARLYFYVSHYSDNTAYIAFDDTVSWHHAVGTYDGANVRLYLDGEEGTPDSYTGNISGNTADLWIGKGRHIFEWDGWISSAAIWERALGKREVLRRLDDPFGLVAPGPSAIRFVIPELERGAVEPALRSILRQRELVERIEDIQFRSEEEEDTAQIVDELPAGAGQGDEVLLDVGDELLRHEWNHLKADWRMTGALGRDNTTGILSPHVSTDKLGAAIFRSGTADGVSGTVTMVTDLRYNGATLEMKTRTATYTGGIITGIGTESAWTVVPTV